MATRNDIECAEPTHRFFVGARLRYSIPLDVDVVLLGFWPAGSRRILALGQRRNLVAGTPVGTAGLAILMRRVVAL